MSENMLFCLGNGAYESNGIGYQKNNMIFNKQVTKEEFSKTIRLMPEINLDLKDGYKEAWAKWWSEASQEDKDKILNCGYFDQEVFKGITGIDVETKSLKGKVGKLEVDGVSYEVELK